MKLEDITLKIIQKINKFKHTYIKHLNKCLFFYLKLTTKIKQTCMEDRKEVIEMEMTIEQKEKRKEYMKGYREENREKLNAYSREYYKNHKEYYQNYYHNYYLENKEHILMNHKLWVEQNSIDSVYCFKNIDGNILYWGSSARFQERISAHCTKNSHLKMSAEEMVSEWFLDKIEYQDFSKYNLNRHDLFWIEKFYKETQEEILKGNAVICDLNKLSRSEDELFEIINNTKFTIFDKLEKYLN